MARKIFKYGFFWTKLLSHIETEKHSLKMEKSTGATFCSINNCMVGSPGFSGTIAFAAESAVGNHAIVTGGHAYEK